MNKKLTVVKVILTVPFFVIVTSCIVGTLTGQYWLGMLIGFGLYVWFLNSLTILEDDNEGL